MFKSWFGSKEKPEYSTQQLMITRQDHPTSNQGLQHLKLEFEGTRESCTALEEKVRRVVYEHLANEQMMPAVFKQAERSQQVEV